ncbi:MAG: hypothetical protein ABR592_02785 [Nitriliruptorales bacterium]
MFRVRYLLGLVTAVGVILAASGVVPGVATAQEKDSFNCPISMVCFYDDPAFNFDTQTSARGNPEVVIDPRPATDASEVCSRLEHQKVPFMAGSARNNTGDAYLELFADDNCSAPVVEPEGGNLDPGGRAYEVNPQAQSFMVLDLSRASATSESAEQQLMEAGGLDDDEVDLDDVGVDHVGEQEEVSQTRRDVSERGASELAHERSRLRRVERLLLGDGREGQEVAPAGTELQQLGLDELEQGLTGRVHVPGG